MYFDNKLGLIRVWLWLILVLAYHNVAYHNVAIAKSNNNLSIKVMKAIKLVVIALPVSSFH